ncbi:3-keto-disaccharide hydrolase [Legionella gresilensis]|uniref:3-keto-disaccharide hydrolase n=1 Tax=Legionella gresilensis TaxID=91823 RepID=UPI00104157F1|nr:DUF1080 domain-containing protein [Legionella gresilensis]
MNLFITILILLISGPLMAKQQTELFNHHDLSGWQHIGEGVFHVKDNLLVTEGGMGLLWYTKQKFGNVKLKVVYKVDYPEANSGIFIRIADKPKDVWDAVHQGYEVQICDKGKEVHNEYYRTGAIYTMAKPLKLASYPPGQWNTFEIIMKNDEVKIFLNDQLVNDFHSTQSMPEKKLYSDPNRGVRPEVGYIGIQNHDHTALNKDSHVYFKEISVTPLKE